jgi:CDP-glucose 4,6-dehydratase
MAKNKMKMDFYKGKKVFITGHTGFKGAWLCKILLCAGAEITGYALESVSPSLFEHLGIKSDINSIAGDVRDRDRLIKEIREASPELLFHLAAQPLVRMSYHEPVLTYETNVMGTVNVLESLRMAPTIRSFVNVTTDKVYENKEWPWGYRENESLCGYDPYSNSKSCSELVTSSYRSSFFSDPDAPAVSTARSGNVIGGGDYAEDRIIPDCIRAVQSGKTIVVRNPNSIRPYQHVLECLAGYLLLSEKQYNNKSLCGAYNFGPNEVGCVTTGELVKLFCAGWGQNTEWSVQEDKNLHEATYLKLDSSKSRSILGWEPLWNINTAVQKVIEFTKCENNNDHLECIDRQIREYFDHA